MSDSVWIVEDDRSLRWVMEEALGEEGHAVRSFADAESFRDALDRETPGLVVMDVRLPGADGLSELDWLAGAKPGLPVLLITAQTDLDMAVTAYERGAFEYLPKPFDLDEFTALVARGLRAGRGKAPELDRKARAGDALVGESPAMQQVFRTIGRLYQSEMSVLITGQSGTGKELVARALHENSPRARGPFVAVNSAAIPAELLESELFGHEKGAFTGAVARRTGRFEQAQGGTLFLDEIGDMPAALQTRLLRVLSEREYYRVGGREPIQANVRVLAATHQDLGQRVAAGDFREDLFHRLNVIRIHIPPLAERPEDIPRLAEHLLDRAAEETGLPPRRFTPKAIQVLRRRPWPGNVRELMNLCRRVTVMSPTASVDAEGLPAPEAIEGTRARGEDWTRGLREWAEQQAQAKASGIAETAREQLEQTLMDWALEKTGGHKQRAAHLLGWGRNTLTRKLRS
ncbi:two-component system nitrogen regulation response regulator GlnG [Natronospira proteinivora]|uniref:DNA-binding transcriptional regulator NtrC n=1 Tax=Natronospira proteinivora TaxID=1807133 RepID=A0ABT1GD06_9GAMM|nr:nitrogen regulation protein NR(I) [Natronospira proteinivora]MCP1728153.1 two-component system nitrogen regulation response regulator GlnG [Natronospira proteinivora]